MKTLRGRVLWIIATFIVLLGAGSIFYYFKNYPNQSLFSSIASVASGVKTFKGDGVCDARIDEPRVNPTDCIAELTLDSKGLPENLIAVPEDSSISRYGKHVFTGVVKVKNIRPEMRNLTLSHVRCYGDAYATDCKLTKEREEDDTTIYRFEAKNNNPYGAGFFPVGVEIKLDESFHIAAIDWFNAYWPNGYNYKRWGSSYQMVLVPLKVGERQATGGDAQRVKQALIKSSDILNQEAQRFDEQRVITLTFTEYPSCIVEPSVYARTISGLESHCVDDTAKEEWYKKNFIVLVSPEETCPTFQVVTAAGERPDPIPATYGSSGTICIATGNVIHAQEQIMVANLVHELLHGFGAADHYSWLDGKDPDYRCNVAEGNKVCSVAAQEVGW